MEHFKKDLGQLGAKFANFRELKKEYRTISNTLKKEYRIDKDTLKKTFGKYEQIRTI